MEEVIKIAGPQCLFFYAWQRAGDRAEGTAQLPGFGPADFTPWLQALAEVNYSQYLSIFMHGHQPEDQMESNISKSKDYLLSCRRKVSQE
jgi:sugar phosphate isomerase/epimerase